MSSRRARLLYTSNTYQGQDFVTSLPVRLRGQLIAGAAGQRVQNPWEIWQTPPLTVNLENFTPEK